MRNLSAKTVYTENKSVRYYDCHRLCFVYRNLARMR